MKIAYKHLLSCIDSKPQISQISKKLFQLGHEHEIENQIFDVEFTPNRGDCLSLHGLLRDLSVFYDTDINVDLYKDNIKTFKLNFKNEASDSCPSITFLKIKIKNQPSEYKEYLERYFDDFKLKKVNFFSDVSNYIAYELGQPLHCYDYEKIDGKISLTHNNFESKFTPLLKKEIQLNDSDLIFKNNDHIINLAGIIGGLNTSCSENTKTALVECAYFRPESIIGKALKYNINTEASHKFERGVDPNCHDKVLRRFIKIIEDHTEIESIQLDDTNTRNFNQKELEVDLPKIEKILGYKIKKEDYFNILDKLGFKINKYIEVPSYRTDISDQNDLAEEFARVIGYDNMPVRELVLPSIESNKKDNPVEGFKGFLIQNGFNEVINIPFTPLKIKENIKIINPLDSNKNCMRSNIVDSLVENLLYNEKRQKDSIKLFEISNLYTLEKNEIIKRQKIAIIISGRQGYDPSTFSKNLDKSYLINLLDKCEFNPNDYIIEIDRQSINSKIKNKIFAIEINTDNLPNNFNEFIPKYKFSDIKFTNFSEFPSCSRDLSFSIKDESKLNDFLAKVEEINSDYLRHFFMFDFFENKKNQTIKIGYRFIFQSNDRTLRDQEVKIILEKILKPILKIESVSVPGLE